MASRTASSKKDAPNTATTILFVRHGRTPTTGQILPGRAKDLHLAEEGHAQASAVAKLIASSFKKIDAVYASPLERARETAAPIGRELSLKVKPHKGLLECDFGDWTGMKLSDLAKLPEWKNVQNHASRFRFPHGESYLEMQARIDSAVADICEQHPGQTVVAVSHADPIKMAVATALSTPLDLFPRINVSLCSVSVISYGSVPAVLTVNSTDLGGLQPS